MRLPDAADSYKFLQVFGNPDPLLIPVQLRDRARMDRGH
jgi:hypothetical protein